MDNKKQNILILGYGEMGHAFEYLLKKSHHISIWEKYPNDGFHSAVLAEAAKKADVVIFCLPIIAHREVLDSIVPLLKPTATCISIAKGIDEDGLIAPQLFEEFLSIKQSYALLYGPMIAEEISVGNPAYADLVCNHTNSYVQIMQLFTDTQLHIRKRRDMPGVSWAVVLKNVYAILFGLADGMGLGTNVRGHLATASLDELSYIVISMGGEPGTAYGYAGLGDLLTTATSPDSHHYTLGKQLANDNTDDIGGEGVHTLAMINKHKLLDYSGYPLFSLVNDIIEKPGVAKELMNAYFEDLQ